MTTTVETSATAISSLSLPILKSNSETPEKTTLLQNLSGLSSEKERIPQPGTHSRSEKSDNVLQNTEISMQTERILIDNALVKLKEKYPRELDNVVNSLNLLNDFTKTSWNDNEYRHQKFKD